MLGTLDKIFGGKLKKRRQLFKAAAFLAVSIKELALQAPHLPTSLTKSKGNTVDLASLDSDEDVVLTLERERSKFGKTPCFQIVLLLFLFSSPLLYLVFLLW